MTADEGALSVWSDALLAAALFALDPDGLGGVSLRGGPGPERDAWIAALRARLPAGAPVRRVPAGIADDRLLGGLDLSASLVAGRPVVEQGVLAACDGGVAILSMAERVGDQTASRIAAVLDGGEVVIERDGVATRLPSRIGLVALDEGVGPEERPPDGLVDRLAFWIDLDAGIAQGDATSPPTAHPADGRARLAAVGPAPSGIIEALCLVAERLGLSSGRTAILALRAARAHAAYWGRAELTDEDAAVAARLVLAPRANALQTLSEAEPRAVPEEEPSRAAREEPEPPPPPEGASPEEPAPGGTPPPAETAGAPDPGEEGAPADAQSAIAAIEAALPEGLLDRARPDVRPTGRAQRAGSGASAGSGRRGRPVGVRTGVLRSGERLSLPDTLRAATPWQRLRPHRPGGPRVQIRQEDFRIRRYALRRGATTVFVVDASGSAAFQRLAEAKGAVELLLAKAYVTRSHVALIAFRNTGAELLMEPTRSLTRAKRSLADLPGGGGTPLAAGLEAALAVARAEIARDRTPSIVILTDGRANIGRDGAPGRAAAEADALAAARDIGAAGVSAVFIDTSPRAQAGGDRFARAMGAVYAPLPYVGAEAVSALAEGIRAAPR